MMNAADALGKAPIKYSFLDKLDAKTEKNAHNAITLCCVAVLLACGVSSALSTEIPEEIDEEGEYVGTRNTMKQRHGKGTYRWLQDTIDNTAGDIYEGDWVNDKKEGRGFLRAENGDLYFGDFANDHFHGSGSLKIHSGTYTGHFKNGKMTGRGHFKFTTGCRYLGEYLDGKMSGTGWFQHANGDKYEGMMLNNHMHGHGTYTYANGDVFTGEFVKNVKQGRGSLRFADGSAQIDAEWEDGELNGAGVVTFRNGDVYKGSWEWSKKTGSVMFARGEDIVSGNQYAYFGYWHGGRELILSPGCVHEEEEESGENSPAPLLSTQRQ